MEKMNQETNYLNEMERLWRTQPVPEPPAMPLAAPPRRHFRVLGYAATVFVILAAGNLFYVQVPGPAIEAINWSSCLRIGEINVTLTQIICNI